MESQPSGEDHSSRAAADLRSQRADVSVWMLEAQLDQVSFSTQVNHEPRG